VLVVGKRRRGRKRSQRKSSLIVFFILFLRLVVHSKRSHLHFFIGGCRLAAAAGSCAGGVTSIGDGALREL
jgi:hypothetical protein